MQPCRRGPGSGAEQNRGERGGATPPPSARHGDGNRHRGPARRHRPRRAARRHRPRRAARRRRLRRAARRSRSRHTRRSRSRARRGCGSRPLTRRVRRGRRPPSGRDVRPSRRGGRAAPTDAGPGHHRAPSPLRRAGAPAACQEGCRPDAAQKDAGHGPPAGEAQRDRRRCPRRQCRDHEPQIDEAFSGGTQGPRADPLLTQRPRTRRPFPRNPRTGRRLAHAPRVRRPLAHRPASSGTCTGQRRGTGRAERGRGCPTARHNRTRG